MKIIFKLIIKTWVYIKLLYLLKLVSFFKSTPLQISAPPLNLQNNKKAYPLEKFLPPSPDKGKYQNIEYRSN